MNLINLKSGINSKDIELYINKLLYVFLFQLLMDIFLDVGNKKKINYLLKIVNKNIIKKEENFLNNNYSIKNFKNIISFVKSQNKIYAGDIIKGILIKIFCSVFKTDKDNNIGKYLYNNLELICNKSNFDLADWFQEDKFKNNELRSIKELLIKDNYAREDFSQLINQSPLFYLLYKINEESYSYFTQRNNNNIIEYMNKGIIKKYEEMKRIFNYLESKYEKTIYDSDIVINSINKVTTNIYSSDNPYNNIYFLIGPIREFFISVFIYYQNKNSPLMKFTKSPKPKDNEIANIPFEYNLNGGYIEGRYSKAVISPICVEPRINKLDFEKNNIREIGLYNLAKGLIFNNNIKEVNLKLSLIRSLFIGYMNASFGIYENHGVESLNLSSNYLNEDCDNDLAKLLSHFKNLKTLNLSLNSLKGGLSHFLISLKKLYRKGKIEIENLFLDKCQLDEKSFYELGELVKCKYCKLKKLYLNENNIPLNVNFLKKLKKNKSLNEIYLGKTEIIGSNSEELFRIMSNTNINYFYLYKNKITDINEFLRIIYRTKFLQDNSNNSNYIKNNHTRPILTNLDLSNNKCLIKNNKHINLIYKIVKETTLECLDISHILCGQNPDKEITNQDEQYKNGIENLVKILEQDKKKYIYAKKELISNKANIIKFKNEENEQKFNHLDEKINEILNNNKSKFPVYLKTNAKILLKNESINKSVNINYNNHEEYKQIEKKLTDYMIYKRSEFVSKILNLEIKKRNLIII